MKIIDKIRAAEERGEPYLALEFFPPRTAEGVATLYQRAQRMALQDPLYVDITWGAGGTTSELTLDIATKLQNDIKVEANMHLTCTNMPAEQVDLALEECKKQGVVNIVALRGDPPKGQEAWTVTEGGFSCALDLVKHIRAKHGDHFCVSVAGYPEGHPNVIKRVNAETKLSEAEQKRVVTLDDGEFVCYDKDYANELAYLKQKVDAGADFIITQMFFDIEVFVQFVQDCRDIGINCPILPGLMLIQNYAGFKRMTAFCKTRVPQWVNDMVEAVKDDDVKVKEAGVSIGVRMCRQIIDAGFNGLHLYTLNLEKVLYGILRELGLYKDIPGYDPDI